MTLEKLIEAGAYVNAGHLDIYTGVKHVRLGDVSAAGDLALSPDGEAYLKGLLPVDEAPVEGSVEDISERRVAAFHAAKDAGATDEEAAAAADAVV